MKEELTRRKRVRRRLAGSHWNFLGKSWWVHWLGYAAHCVATAREATGGEMELISFPFTNFLHRFQLIQTGRNQYTWSSCSLLLHMTVQSKRKVIHEQTNMPREGSLVSKFISLFIVMNFICLIHYNIKCSLSFLYTVLSPLHN